MTSRSEWWVRKVFFAATALSAVAIFVLLFLLVYFSVPMLTSGHVKQLLSWHWKPYAGDYGILPMVLGTLLLATLSTIMAIPISMGVCAFAYTHENSGATKLLILVVHVMTGIPTVIYGFVSVFVLVPLIRRIFVTGAGFCLLTAALILGLLISPTIILIFHASLAQLASSLRPVVESLGLSPMEQFRFVMLPAASQGLLTAVILGFCRAAGDAIIPLMLAGNAAQVPGSLLDAIRTLSAHIALVLATDSQSMAYQSVFASGMSLFIVTAAATMLIRRYNRKALDRWR